MNRLLKDIPREEVSAMIEDSLCDYCCKAARSGRKPFGLEEKIDWVKTCPTYWPNFIYSARFTDREVAEQISNVTVRIKSGELPDEWIVGPKTYPANLGESLISSGYEKRYEMSGMAVDLTKLDGKAAPPSNCTIRVVDTPDMLRTWAGIVSNGLFEGNTIETCVFEGLLQDDAFRFYIAFLDGEPAASSMFQLSGGIVTINMVATMPQCRRMGIGTAMTLTPLLDARELGYAVGVLQASQAGEPVYRKIGFEEYCRFYVYKYCP
jgi:ribosomal protein S18 acetylase RimI-like enzyme